MSEYEIMNRGRRDCMGMQSACRLRGVRGGSCIDRCALQARTDLHDDEDWDGYDGPTIGIEMPLRTAAKGAGLIIGLLAALTVRRLLK